MRGPAEARAARGESSGAEEPLPPGVNGADFRTLQDLIAKGIQEAEIGATTLEADIKESKDDTELRRHRELLRQRREEDLAARQREKELAREKRRREDEARRKKLEAEMEQEEEQERRQKEDLKNVEASCRRQFTAVVRIQALFRGRRSRAGKHIASPVVTGKMHAKPWASQDT